MRRAIGRASRRIAIVTLLLFGLTVAVPAGAVPADNWPVSWLWSWASKRPLWSAAAAALGAPAMAGPAPFTGDHHVPADATDADGGAGRVAEQAAGTLPPYQPHDPAVPTTPTGVAEPGFDAATSRRDASEATARSRAPPAVFRTRAKVISSIEICDRMRIQRMVWLRRTQVRRTRRPDMC
ncbi:hypothetical protein O7623_09740 [Solwaraspora sp. WMMD791]|uniref:hypothetical protein n=1 Tax=Solwaraspora sp. WMMD791 TaxID=3016086 RepID=UPI00249A5E3B|nr:hypothetical protein [Solwaraspora sp. WMMD791]WFE29443.1 hypothetical protein O7623_09740 [Solwaraspora sp. WMMD791]